MSRVWAKRAPATWRHNAVLCVDTAAMLLTAVCRTFLLCRRTCRGLGAGSNQASLCQKVNPSHHNLSRHAEPRVTAVVAGVSLDLKTPDSAQEPQDERLLFPHIFSWAQTDPVFGLVQPEDTELGSKGVNGKVHQEAVMKDATALLDIYEAFMKDRAARSKWVFIPWPIDRQNEVDLQNCSNIVPKAVVVSEKPVFCKST